MWHFLETGHEKGPCDGVGGRLKRMAKEATAIAKFNIRNAPNYVPLVNQDGAQCGELCLCQCL